MQRNHMLVCAETMSNLHQLELVLLSTSLTALHKQAHGCIP